MKRRLLWLAAVAGFVWLYLRRGVRRPQPVVQIPPTSDPAEELRRKLEDLHSRVHRGAYRAQPGRRVFIPKPDGRQRPLSVAALEDKIVQRAVATVLNAIYETDFLGFSHGFRPGKGAHDALGVGDEGLGKVLGLGQAVARHNLAGPPRADGVGSYLRGQVALALGGRAHVAQDQLP